jgi:hypothetical protein
MATLTVARKTPFKRGDESLELFLDGKKAGVLLKEPVIVSLEPGEHTLQASQNGARGRKVTISVSAEDTELMYEIGDANLYQAPWWNWIIFFIPIILPDQLFHGEWFWAKIGAYVVLLAAAVYQIVRIVKSKRKFLAPERSQTATQLAQTI